MAISAPTHEQPYQVDLTIERDQGARAGLFQIALDDRERIHTRTATDAARLDFPAQRVRGSTLTARRLLELFLAGDDLGLADALALGRFVAARLFQAPTLRQAWNDIGARRGLRPLRLELQVPDDDVDSIAEIPFELLADEHGFIFRRPGAVLVRAIQGMSVAEYRVPRQAGVAVAWANPACADASRIGADILKDHEDAARAAAKRHDWPLHPPCASASLGRLESYLREVGATGAAPVLSLVAHGSPGGGSLVLHDDRHPAFPDDPGENVSARDLALRFKHGGVKVACLWTCHGARRHPLAGSIAAALLDPQGGDLAAVLASQAAL
jgi:hypothetical protein